MKTYEVLLISTDGDNWQVEGENCKTIAEAQEVSVNMGSRWIFYPYHFIIRQYLTHYCFPSIERQYILAAPPELEFLTGKTVKTAMKHIADNMLMLCEMFNI